MMTMLGGKRVLVTGATGFIGGHLARRLHTEGAHVLALERTAGKGADLARSGIEIVRGDITDSKQMEAILRQNVQIVMHIAAWLTGRPLSNYQRINVEATRQLAQLAASTGVDRFVFTSSIAVYGPHGDANVDETTHLQFYGNPYGDTKIHAEQALHEVRRRTNLAIAIVRPGMVYGPGSRSWTVRLARWARRGVMPLIDGGRATAYPVYIDNLVDLLVACATHPAASGEVFNGVDDGPVTFAAFLGAYMAMIPTSRAIRLPGWVLKILLRLAAPFSPNWSLTYIANQLCGRGMVSNWKAKDHLGWHPRVSLSDGMAASEAWLRQSGILEAEG